MCIQQNKKHTQIVFTRRSDRRMCDFTNQCTPVRGQGRNREKFSGNVFTVYGTYHALAKIERERNRSRKPSDCHRLGLCNRTSETSNISRIISVFCATFRFVRFFPDKSSHSNDCPEKLWSSIELSFENPMGIKIKNIRNKQAKRVKVQWKRNFSSFSLLLVFFRRYDLV